MGAAARPLIIAFLLSAGPAVPAVRAQSTNQTSVGAIEGRVLTAAGEGLEDVDVSIRGLPGVAALTGPDGRFTLEDIPPGWVEVRFTRIGYALRSTTVLVEAGIVGRVEAVLSEQAIELSPIDVTVSDESVYLGVNGFYRRSERGFGRQYSRQDLDALHMLKVADAFHSIPGLFLASDPYDLSRMMAVRARVRGQDSVCPLTVFVDGVRTLDPNLNQVPPDWLLGMEVYLGAEAPAQYRLAGSCGAVLLWTKDGRR